MRIREDRRRIVLPAIDNIRFDTFEVQQYASAAHGYTWGLWCMYIVPPQDWLDRGDEAAPIRWATHSGPPGRGGSRGGGGGRGMLRYRKPGALGDGEAAGAARCAVGRGEGELGGWLCFVTWVMTRSGGEGTDRQTDRARG